MRLLCLWISGKGHQGSSVDLLQPQITTEQVADLLLDLIDEQYDWDVNRAYDIQMVGFFRVLF